MVKNFNHLRSQTMKATLALVIGAGYSSGALGQSSAPAGTASPEPKVTWSQNRPKQDDSYAAQYIHAQGVHIVDPNIWAYSAEFAEKYKMPKDWIAPDLKGAEAVAFRVHPDFRSCGWGGDPTSCRDDETRCAVDVYFDQTKQPLPWEESTPGKDIDFYSTSTQFLLRAVKRTRSIQGGYRRAPFTDAATGSELYWQVLALGSTRGGGMAVAAYDRNMGENLSFISMRQPGCYTPKNINLKSQATNEKKSQTFHEIDLPADWMQRVNGLISSVEAKNEAHYRKIFEKINSNKN
jgi:hypothetical protein